MQTNILYSPAPAEISTIINRGKAKHPAVTFLYDDAQRILAQGHLGFAFDLWHCLSQSDASKVYQLYNGECTCPAYTKAMYQLAGHRYCKHNIAYFALVNILTAHFNERFIGNNINPTAVQRLRAQPNTWLIQNSHTPGFHSHNGEQGYFICYATQLPISADHPDLRWAPTNPVQLAHFSSWLATTAVHPLPTAFAPTTSYAYQPSASPTAPAAPVHAVSA